MNCKLLISKGAKLAKIGQVDFFDKLSRYKNFIKP